MAGTAASFRCASSLVVNGPGPSSKVSATHRASRQSTSPGGGIGDEDGVGPAVSDGVGSGPGWAGADGLSGLRVAARAAWPATVSRPSVVVTGMVRVTRPAGQAATWQAS